MARSRDLQQQHLPFPLADATALSVNQGGWPQTAKGFAVPDEFVTFDRTTVAYAKNAALWGLKPWPIHSGGPY